MLICPPPIRVQLRNSSVGRRGIVNREDFGELSDTQWPRGNSKTLQEATRMFSICLIDLLQHPFVCLVQRLGQFLKNSPHTWWKTVSQRFQLAVHPPEPISSHQNLSTQGTGGHLTCHQPSPRASRSQASYPPCAISVSSRPNKR